MDDGGVTTASHVFNYTTLSIFIVGLQIDRLLTDFTVFTNRGDGDCRQIILDQDGVDLNQDPPLVRGIEMEMSKRGETVTARVRFGEVRIRRGQVELAKPEEWQYVHPRAVVDSIKMSIDMMQDPNAKFAFSVQRGQVDHLAKFLGIEADDQGIPRAPENAQTALADKAKDRCMQRDNVPGTPCESGRPYCENVYGKSPLTLISQVAPIDDYVQASNVQEVEETASPLSRLGENVSGISSFLTEWTPSNKGRFEENASRSPKNGATESGVAKAISDNDATAFLGRITHIEPSLTVFVTSSSDRLMNRAW